MTQNNTLLLRTPPPANSNSARFAPNWQVTDAIIASTLADVGELDASMSLAGFERLLLGGPLSQVGDQGFATVIEVLSDLVAPATAATASEDAVATATAAQPTGAGGGAGAHDEQSSSHPAATDSATVQTTSDPVQAVRVTRHPLPLCISSSL